VLSPCRIHNDHHNKHNKHTDVKAAVIICAAGKRMSAGGAGGHRGDGDGGGAAAVTPGATPGATTFTPAELEAADIMGSDSMVRILEAQTDTIVPHELPIIAGYVAAGLVPPHARVLSVGCGTGAFEAAMLAAFPGFEVTGIDIDEGHVERAVVRNSARGPRAEFMVGDALHLAAEWTGTFHLVLNRHMLQEFPPAAVAACLAELGRVARPAGVVHLLAEDYGMIYFDGTALDTDSFWRASIEFGAAAGGDWLVGRKVARMCTQLRDAHTGAPVFAPGGVSQRILTLSSLQPADRAGLLRIWAGWAEGYTGALSKPPGPASRSAMSAADVRAHWEDQLAALAGDGHGQWFIPIITAVKAP